MCPLALIAGFVDAIAGGGGLISLPAYFFAGLPPHAAIATNKLSSTLGTLVATVRYALFGYMVKRFVVAGVACGQMCIRDSVSRFSSAPASCAFPRCRAVSCRCSHSPTFPRGLWKRA